jgi:uncharacterized protein YbjT (DUF2867 family)
MTISTGLRVLLFGASGMVGQGVLRECLLDAEVASVCGLGRSAIAIEHPKLQHLVHLDLSDYSAIESRLTGFDACFFCLGISAAGMTEQAYEKVTYGIALAAAETLCRLNPGMTFSYVSGSGTDSSERGRTMWARVKGKTENALLRLPFKGAYMFRPAAIQAAHDERSKTSFYRALYVLLNPLLPLLRRALPDSITTTEKIGRAMLIVAKRGNEKQLLESADINAIR